MGFARLSYFLFRRHAVLRQRLRKLLLDAEGIGGGARPGCLLQIGLTIGMKRKARRIIAELRGALNACKFNLTAPRSVLSREWLKFEGEFVYSNLHRRCRADGDHAMKTDTTNAAAAVEGTLFLRDDWFDPLEAGVRTRIRDFIEELLEAEFDAALARKRYEPDRLHDELSADYKDMIYVGTKQEIETKVKAFIRKWRLKRKAVADSLEEAGGKLFTFTRFPKSQWKSIRTSNAIERLHEEFRRRIKTQTVLPSAETAAMLFWALLASGQITMRKVDGWQSLNERPSD